ncbi:phage tail sheath family protein [Burkholderia ubonensis]|uniref:phage tail sheath family protein n=1 Tax=Burkholderia ubonensis TaxID=101571 RepID=UPI0018DF571C|nr:phage tail sheath family protein [Burkholderia ubonensis]
MPFTLQEIADFSDFEEKFGGPPQGSVSMNGGVGALYYSVKHYFDNDGGGAFVLSLGSYVDAAGRSGAEIVASFANPLITTAVQGQLRITLIAIPDMVLLPDSEITLWQEAWQTLLNLCQSRDGLFGLLDTPDGPYEVINCLSTFSGSGREWGAAYWPRLLVAVDGKNTVIPPSGALAAAIERIDIQSGVWTAPANVVLGNVIAPTQSYSWVNDAFVCGDASFNLIRAFPGRGTRVWGCRTLSTDAALPTRYVQVRRLVSYIEVQVSQLVRMYVFEPNSDITWFKVKGQVSNWLRNLWLMGGLYGTEETQAFEVAVGLNETMTSDDVAAGIMIVGIRLSTLFPAEFIELALQFDMRMPTGA